MQEDDFLEKRTVWLSNIMQLPGFSREKALNMALKRAEENKKKKDDPPEDKDTDMLDMLSVWANAYRDLLLLKIGGPIDLLINIDFSNQLKKNAGSFTVENLVDSIMAVHQARSDILRSGNATLVLVHLVLGLNRLAGKVRRNE